MTSKRKMHNLQRGDTESAKQSFLPHFHALVHEERAFQLTVAVGLGAGLNRVYLVQADADLAFHLDSFSLYSDRDASVELFDQTIPDAPVGGAPFVMDTDIFNKHRGSAIAPLATIVDAPTEAGAWVIGTLMDYGQIDVAANQTFASGQATLGQEEWVLEPGGNHAIRVTNRDGGNALTGVFKMLFYEAVP